MAAPDIRLELYARPQRLVDIGGRRINVCLSGEGSPTIVLAAGMGGTTIGWAPVQRRLSETNTVLSYDRAGLGFSDPGGRPSTTQNIVEDLRAVLKALGLAPPYILAGHSAGSFDVRLFAFQHPEEVTGMVLADPSSEYQVERFAQITPRGTALHEAALARYRRCEQWAAAANPVPGSAEYAECVPPPDRNLPDSVNEAMRAWRLSPVFWRTLHSLDFSFSDGDSREQLKSAGRKLGAMPLVVLTAGKMAWGSPSEEEATRLHAAWRQMHDELAALSSRGVRREVAAGHGIPVERPDIVADAIREVIALAQAGASA